MNGLFIIPRTMLFRVRCVQLSGILFSLLFLNDEKGQVFSCNLYIDTKWCRCQNAFARAWLECARNFLQICRAKGCRARIIDMTMPVATCTREQFLERELRAIEIYRLF